MLIYLLLPVTILIFAMGTLGGVYVRRLLISQWGEAATLKLQLAVHQVDMQLSRPKELIRAFHKTGDSDYFPQLHGLILKQLRETRGVARVDLTWENGEEITVTPGFATQEMGMGSGRHIEKGRQRMMSFKWSGIHEITFPRYDTLMKNVTVSLISDLKDDTGATLGTLEVVMKFDHIIDAIITSGWLQSHQAYLVDDSGKVLMSTFSNSHDRLGYHDDPLEQETLMEMKKKPFGTLIGQRHSASEVSGFYRLNEAPWNLVMFAPASEILAPISRFQRYHLAMVIVFIVLILLLIRFVVGRAADSIKEVSKAAVEVSHGEYSITLPVKTQDEIGELTRSFNTMILQLEERSRLKAALSLARDVQQNLIPRTTPSVRGIDVAAKIIYCEETGGDYYDFIEFDASNQQKLGVVLGDVSDHGIPSALLMATVRSSIRQRAFMPGSIAQIVSDVNRQLAHDVVDSGQFMTLFFLLIDPQKRMLHWVRAGHDPGIFYDPGSKTFESLKGDGIALGVDADWAYEENRKSGIGKGQIIALGTDGIWEAQNPKGEMFGKAPITGIIQENADKSAADIMEAIINRLAEFREGKKLEDDVTLVIIKIEDDSPSHLKDVDQV